MRWQKDKDPLAPGRNFGERSTFPISAIALIAVALTVFSFLIWDGSEGVGEVSSAVSFFEDFFNENDAIAVFLGWYGE